MTQPQTHTASGHAIKQWLHSKNEISPQSHRVFDDWWLNQANWEEGNRIAAHYNAGVPNGNLIMSQKQTAFVLDPNANPSPHELLIYINHSTRDGLIICLASDNEWVGESMKCTQHRGHDVWIFIKR